MEVPQTGNATHNLKCRSHVWKKVDSCDFVLLINCVDFGSGSAAVDMRTLSDVVFSMVDVDSVGSVLMADPLLIGQ